MGFPVYDVVGIVGAEMFWTMIESTVALIAICLPTIGKAVNSMRLGKNLSIRSMCARLQNSLSFGTTSTLPHIHITETVDVELGDRSPLSSRSGLKDDIIREDPFALDAGFGPGAPYKGFKIHKDQEMTYASIYEVHPPKQDSSSTLS